MIPEKITTIEQRAFLRGYQKLEIRPDGDLEVCFKRFSIQRQFRIPLSQINSKSERHKFQNVGSLVGFIIFGVLSLFTLWGVISCLLSEPDRSVAAVLLFPLIFFLVFAGVCFSRFRQQSVNAVIFYVREGGQIHVWFEKPDAKTFNSFCETLSKKCEAAWNNRPLDPSVQSIAGEIAALKKLHEKGVLSDAEFERAKAKLIEQTEERKIGFA
jgi:ribosomal protein S20